MCLYNKWTGTSVAVGRRGGGPRLDRPLSYATISLSGSLRRHQAEQALSTIQALNLDLCYVITSLCFLSHSSKKEKVCETVSHLCSIPVNTDLQAAALQDRLQTNQH